MRTSRARARMIDDGDPCEQNMCDSTLIVDAAR